MPRFYFDVTEDDLLAIDDAGSTCHWARSGPLPSTLAELAHDAIRRCPPALTLVIDVRDDNGSVLRVRLRYQMEEARSAD
jgi:hypothetical protein